MQNSASASPSAVWKSFLTPGNVVDFPTDPARQAAMNQLWNDNVAGWLTAALTGDVWDLVNYGPRPAFYDPLTTGTPADAALAPIPWNAFPARISVMFPDQPTKWNEWADTGDLPQITQNLCTGPIAATPYTPTGPRGWQDEYCEWSVRRDPDTQEILSIMFTCENPEYWLTLWRVSPQAVLAVYRQLVNPAVTLDDLSLTDSQGFVTDPANGNQRVYNPLNKWNRGTQTLPTSGGAMHLTSSPNTLGAEYDLAAAATMPRVSGTGQPITSSQPLICCAKYRPAGASQRSHDWCERERNGKRWFRESGPGDTHEPARPVHANARLDTVQQQRHCGPAAIRRLLLDRGPRNIGGSLDTRRHRPHPARDIYRAARDEGQ